MADVVLHETTAQAVERYIQLPAHGVLIVGATGMGKKALVQQIVSRILRLTDVEALQRYPFIRIVAPADKASIGIEAIRDLQQFAKLKLPKGAQNKRFLIIHEAHTLTTEAQNALLKLLEEPPEDTALILTVADEQALLPTIRSRSQQLTVHRPSHTQLHDFFSQQGHDAAAIKQAYMLSGGLPGLQHALLEDGDHPLKQSVQMARTVLQGNTFQRLCLVDELTKKRPECQQLLFVMQHMAQAAIEQTAQAAGDPVAAGKRLTQWHKVLKAAYQAEQSLRANAQAKLVLDNLMLAL